MCGEVDYWNPHFHFRLLFCTFLEAELEKQNPPKDSCLNKKFCSLAALPTCCRYSLTYDEKCHSLSVYGCYADTWELQDYTSIEVITTITIYCKANQKMTYTQFEILYLIVKKD